MAGISVPLWALLYLGAAVLFALAIAVYAEDRWSADPPSSAFRAVLIAVGGALWPVLAVGLGQLAVVGAIARRMRPSAPVAGERPALAARH